MASNKAISLTQLSAWRCMCVRLWFKLCVCVHVLWRNQERVPSVQLLHVLCFSSRLNGGSKTRTCEVFTVFILSVLFVGCATLLSESVHSFRETLSTHARHVTGFDWSRGSCCWQWTLLCLSASGRNVRLQSSKSLWWSALSLTEGFRTDSLIEGQCSHSLATTPPDT